MKKLKTDYDGGFPFVLDDIRYQAEGIYEALKAICKSMLPEGSGSVILTGCEITNPSTNHYHISAGYIYLVIEGYGEIYEVEAHEVNTTGGLAALQWCNVQTWDSAGLKTFFDSQSHNCYEIQRAHVIEDNDPTYPPVNDVLNINGNWVLPTLLGTWDHGVDDNLYYRYIKAGLSFKGSISGVSGDLFVLPEKLWPDHIIRVPIICGTIELNYLAYLVITDEGEVQIESVYTGPDPINYIINVVIPL